MEMAVCPVCQQRLRAKNLDLHIETSHPHSISGVGKAADSGDPPANSRIFGSAESRITMHGSLKKRPGGKVVKTVEEAEACHVIQPRAREPRHHPKRRDIGKVRRGPVDREEDAFLGQMTAKGDGWSPKFSRENNNDPASGKSFTSRELKQGPSAIEETRGGAAVSGESVDRQQAGQSLKANKKRQKLIPTVTTYRLK